MAKKIKYEKINPKPPLREDSAVEEAQEEALENPEETAASETASEPSPLEEALKQAAEYKDMALRQRAEFENYRKNNQNLSKEVRERTIVDVLESILPVLDSFDRAEQAITDENTLTGLSIIKEQFKLVLAKYNVTEIAAAGKDFDPNFHNCIMQVEKEDMTGKVVYEIQKGYMLGDKVLRHSVVAVGK